MGHYFPKSPATDLLFKKKVGMLHSTKCDPVLMFCRCVDLIFFFKLYIFSV